MQLCDSPSENLSLWLFLRQNLSKKRPPLSDFALILSFFLFFFLYQIDFEHLLYSKCWTGLQKPSKQDRVGAWLQTTSNLGAYFGGSFKKYFYFILIDCLCWVLVVACGIYENS